MTGSFTVLCKFELKLGSTKGTSVGTGERYILGGTTVSSGMFCVYVGAVRGRYHQRVNRRITLLGCWVS